MFTLLVKPGRVAIWEVWVVHSRLESVTVTAESAQVARAEREKPVLDHDRLGKSNLKRVNGVLTQIGYCIY